MMRGERSLSERPVVTVLVPLEDDLLDPFKWIDPSILDTLEALDTQ